MGAIRDVIVYSDSALIAYRKENEPHAGIYVGQKSDLLLELSRVQVDAEDVLKVVEVQKRVFLQGIGFQKTCAGKRTIDLDTHEMRYLTARQSTFDRYAARAQTAPIAKSPEPQLIELSCFGSADDRRIAVGGVAPNGEYWLVFHLSVEGAIESISAAGISLKAHRHDLKRAEESGLARYASTATPACFFGELAFVMNCAAALLKRLSFN